MIITIGDSTLLVDPMFASAGATDAITNTPNPWHNPLPDLPLSEDSLRQKIATIDAVFVTHLHNDHWDGRARELLPRSLPLYCRPEDRRRIEEAGFEEARQVVETADWRGLRITRTGGRHGRGQIGRLMAPVSGFVIQTAGDHFSMLPAIRSGARK